MTLMKALEKQLDKEIAANETPKDTETVNTQELYSQLMEKKLKEMETMFNQKMNILIESMQKKEHTEPTKTVEQEGVNNDSTTDVPNAE